MAMLKSTAKGHMSWTSHFQEQKVSEVEARQHRPTQRQIKSWVLPFLKRAKMKLLKLGNDK
jgi:hypothetical protein